MKGRPLLSKDEHNGRSLRLQTSMAASLGLQYWLRLFWLDSTVFSGQSQKPSDHRQDLLNLLGDLLTLSRLLMLIKESC
jgi:hypothetical protein